MISLDIILYREFYTNEEISAIMWLDSVSFLSVESYLITHAGLYCI